MFFYDIKFNAIFKKLPTHLALLVQPLWDWKEINGQAAKVYFKYVYVVNNGKGDLYCYT